MTGASEKCTRGGMDEAKRSAPVSLRQSRQGAVDTLFARF